MFAPSGFASWARKADDHHPSGFGSWAEQPTLRLGRLRSLDTRGVGDFRVHQPRVRAAAGYSGEIYFGEDPEGLATKCELDR